MRVLEGRLATNQPTPSERLARAFDVKGDLPNVMDPTIGLDVVYEDLTAPEYLWLKRTQSWAGSGEVVATALNFGAVHLGAPTSHEGLAVCDRVTITNITAAPGGFRVGIIGNVAPAANLNGKQRDSRMGVAGSPAFAVNPLLYVGANLTIAASQFVWIPANTSVVVEGPWIISGLRRPGATQQDSLLVETNVVNQAILASFTWTERQLLTSER